MQSSEMQTSESYENETLESETESSDSSAGKSETAVIAAAVAACLITVIGIAAIVFYWKSRKQHKENEPSPSDVPPIPMGDFEIKYIELEKEQEIGRGHFGIVYV